VITSRILHPGGRPRGWWRRRRQVLAIFSFRYDAHLVPDLLANLEPIVDGWVAWDDRGSSEPFSDEWQRLRALVEEAKRLGAHWVLAVDPDERLEAAVAKGIGRLLARRRPTIWSFQLREMFTPTAYRVDGIWGGRLRNRLFPVHVDLRFDEAALHAKRVPLNRGFRQRNSGFNLYHLRMISPERRRLRRDLNKVLDPAARFQDVGYDYLAEDAGAVLEEIPRGREYFPPHREDGGRWTLSEEAMAVLRPIVPDGRAARNRAG
jgi:hypothetical protein